MNVDKTLRRANALFEKLNASIEASDLKRALATERKFREGVCKFANCNDGQMPHAVRILTNRVKMILSFADSNADAKSVTDWILA